jgi:hypothetical protein
VKTALKSISIFDDVGKMAKSLLKIVLTALKSISIFDGFDKKAKT